MNKYYLPRVVSGLRPAIFLATSIGSTFARLANAKKQKHHFTSQNNLMIQLPCKHRHNHKGHIRWPLKPWMHLQLVVHTFYMSSMCLHHFWEDAIMCITTQGWPIKWCTIPLICTMNNNVTLGYITSSHAIHNTCMKHSFSES